LLLATDTMQRSNVFWNARTLQPLALPENNTDMQPPPATAFDEALA
jgi:hypothetical protein